MKANKARSAQLPTEIETLARVNIDDAITLAMRGEKFSEFESRIEHYFWTLGEWAKVSNGQPSSVRVSLGDGMAITPTEEFKMFKASMERQTDAVAELFLDALDRRDANNFREIADAIDRVKNFKPTQQDRIRYEVLSLGLAFNKSGLRIEIRQLAMMLGYTPKQIGDMSADGFSALRRLAKRVKFPLAKSRKGRPKKRSSDS